MSDWNAEHYLKYGDERTRPAADLAARIRIDRPAVIADLGCGPGNSTQILRDRWPQSEIIGIDNSPQMIEAARRAYPDQKWLLADVSQWTSSGPVDLLYSNAALQWLPDHGALMPRLFGMVAAGGALAFQIPSSTYATVRTLIHDISYRPAWSERMNAPRNALTMECPAFYYDALVKIATNLDLWETEYSHVLESAASIVDWISSTGLRPFLAALDTDAERAEFTSELHQRVRDAYQVRADGKVLFPFRRTFVIAYR
ncbi:MAG: trans-aconitate 2-methyltransferase [Planctomycetota bacterium]|nr:MAG: trans-aconitate 2-methyltransferase [Planctomycetota bacterium]